MHDGRQFYHPTHHATGALAAGAVLCGLQAWGIDLTFDLDLARRAAICRALPTEVLWQGMPVAAETDLDLRRGLTAAADIILAAEVAPTPTDLISRTWHKLLAEGDRKAAYALRTINSHELTLTLSCAVATLPGTILPSPTTLRLDQPLYQQPPAVREAVSTASRSYSPYLSGSTAYLNLCDSYPMCHSTVERCRLATQDLSRHGVTGMTDGDLGHATRGWAAVLFPTDNAAADEVIAVKSPSWRLYAGRTVYRG